jgi:MurNAc alpha-1-phosphate uridylyltransferase
VSEALSNLPAMVLAAGRGERMRPLSDTTPKPLLRLRGKPLIAWHLEALARDGVRDAVVNTAWLEQDLVDFLGDGSEHGLSIAVSREGRDWGGALETAGGIATALPLFDRAGDAFWLVSADIWAPDFVFDAARARAFAASGLLAHLWMVPNPAFHPAGDFGIDADGFAVAGGDGPRWTYANLALVHRDLVAGIAAGTRAKLADRLVAGMQARRITAELHPGRWDNIGTPEQLAALERSGR